MMVGRPKASADWLIPFAEELHAFARGLPPSVRWEFERDDGRYFRLDIYPPTDRHRRLVIEGSPPEITYELGKVWTEGLEPTAEVRTNVLAACDAVRDGKVREVRDLDTGALYHVYRLKTRGCDAFIKDSQYSFWHWFKRRVKRVRAERLPPLSLA
jgi:hypothetical protein